MDGHAIEVSGIPWTNGVPQVISSRSLASNILCRRHNSALATLDDHAAKLIGYIRADEEALDRLGKTAEPVDLSPTFTLASGPLWERWLLKVLLGGVASKAFARDGAIATVWNDEIVHAELIEVLFRGARAPEGTGLCVLPYAVDERGRQYANDDPRAVGIAPLVSTRGGLAGVTIQLGAVHLSYSAVKADPTLLESLGGLAIERESPFAEKLFAFAWPSPNSGNFRLSSTPPAINFI